MEARVLHRADIFLPRRRLFFALAAASVVAFVLQLARARLRHSSDFAFLNWNLFLAWLPYMASLAAERLSRNDPRRHKLMLCFAALWLVFLPNAPYIITDVCHLEGDTTPRWWCDLALIMTYAWIGFLLGLASLRIMQSVFSRRHGTAAGWACVAIAAPLAGLGVYVGRFLRWNSWDVLLHPRGIMRKLILALLDPLQHTRAMAFILVFAMFFLIAYVTFTAWRSEA